MTYNYQDFIQVNHYIINLGKSVSRYKSYYFKTNLNLSDEFITFPYGTTRTRFQFQEPFTYILKNIISTDILYTEPLKNDPDIKFYILTVYNRLSKNGWDFNLKVLNIQKIDLKQSENQIHNPIIIDGIHRTEISRVLSLETIQALLPEKYGNITINYGNTYINSCNPIIGIVIPIYNRHEYLIQCLNSLSMTNLSNCILCLIDESMTKDVNPDKIRTRELVEKFVIDHGSNKDTEPLVLIKIYKNIHGNMYDSILSGFDCLSTFCDYLVTLDSDTVQKPDFITKSLEVYRKVIHDHTDDVSSVHAYKILLTGFNTVNRGNHRILKEEDTYYIKDSIGGCHLMFHLQAYHTYLRKALISYKWDTNIITVFKQYILSPKVIIAVKPSVVNHIGYISSMRDDQNYDVSFDY